MLICPIFTLTFYPAAYPSVDSPLVLQSASHYLEGQKFLPLQVEQAVQVAEFVRGEAPDFYQRGQRTTQLNWVEVRRFATPGEALAESLELAESVPTSTGWLSIVIPDEARAWAVTPCAIRAMAGSPEKAGAETLLKITWTLLCGAIAEVATVAEPYAWLWEDGTEILWEDGEYLALESLP